MSKLISLIVSVYNEENGLKQFYETTKSIMDKFTADSAAEDKEYSYELCFVNDGSSDNSGSILTDIKSADSEHVTLISFSRNFGHEAAMTAGLDYASGDYLIFMDADLQHPPALIPDIIARFEKGAEVISMVRTKNESAGGLKNLTSDLFYKLINEISETRLIPGASDFFAIDSNAAKVLRENYREKVRFLRGYVQNIGFNKDTIEYEAAARVAGHSHYSIKKLWKFSMDTIICFSNVPLKLGIYAGLASGTLGILLIIYTLLTRNGAPSGYATIVIVLCFMFAVLFMLLGILGSYIAVLFREMQDRPIYIVKDVEKAAGGCINEKMCDSRRSAD